MLLIDTVGHVGFGSPRRSAHLQCSHENYDEIRRAFSYEIAQQTMMRSQREQETATLHAANHDLQQRLFITEQQLQSIITSSSWTMIQKLQIFFKTKMGILIKRVLLKVLHWKNASAKKLTG